MSLHDFEVMIASRRRQPSPLHNSCRTPRQATRCRTDDCEQRQFADRRGPSLRVAKTLEACDNENGKGDEAPETFVEQQNGSGGKITDLRSPAAQAEQAQFTYFSVAGEVMFVHREGRQHATAEKVHVTSDGELLYRHQRAKAGTLYAP